MRGRCRATAVAYLAEHVSALEQGDVWCVCERDVTRPLIHVSGHVVHAERRDAARSRTGEFDVGAMCALDVARIRVALPTIRVGESIRTFTGERPLVVVAQTFSSRCAKLACFIPRDVHARFLDSRVCVLVSVDTEAQRLLRTLAECVTNDVAFTVFDVLCAPWIHGPR